MLAVILVQVVFQLVDQPGDLIHVLADVFAAPLRALVGKNVLDALDAGLNDRLIHRDALGRVVRSIADGFLFCLRQCRGVALRMACARCHAN